jgi:hypothetical protein
VTIGTHWRLVAGPSAQRSEWLVENINNLQRALHALELYGVKLPFYNYETAEELLDELRDEFADNDADSESD